MGCVLILLALITPCLGAVQELYWNLTYVQNAKPDGLAERRVIGVNGQWPYVKTELLLNISDMLSGLLL